MRFTRSLAAAAVLAAPLFAAAARELPNRSYTRFVGAGGETSGAVANTVANHLGKQAMRNGADIAPGVHVLTFRPDAPVALSLKSSDFGEPDLFAKAFPTMEGRG